MSHRAICPPIGADFARSVPQCCCLPSFFASDSSGPFVCAPGDPLSSRRAPETCVPSSSSARFDRAASTFVRISEHSPRCSLNCSKRSVFFSLCYPLASLSSFGDLLWRNLQGSARKRKFIRKRFCEGCRIAPQLGALSGRPLSCFCLRGRIQRRTATLVAPSNRALRICLSGC